MDPLRFDDLTRSLMRLAGRRPSRRLVLQLFGGGVIASGLSTGLDAEAKGNNAKKRKRKRQRRRRRRCRGGTTRCGGTCIDLLTNPSHCGACNSACDAGSACQNGDCTGGGCTPDCAGKACGASDGCGGQCSNGTCPEGETCGGGGVPNECGASGPPACDPPCGFNQECENGTCVAAPNRCSGPTGICNADPTPCGTSATDETCGCERTVEGNTICVNGGDNVCPDPPVECTSSQDCRDSNLGFHFYCQEAKRNAQGQFCGCGFGTATGRVCVPECDNPSIL